MKALFNITFLLIATLGFAQTLEFKHGVVVEESRLLGKTSIYHLSNSQIIAKQPVTIVSFDSVKFNLQAKIENRSLFYPNKYHKIGDKFYVEQLIKEGKVKNLSLTQVDLSSLSNMNETQKVIESTAKSDAQKFVALHTSTSIDNSKFCGLYRDKKTTSLFKVEMYNEILEEAWSHSFSFRELTTPLSFIHDAIVTKNGEAVFLIGTDATMHMEREGYTSNKSDRYYLVIVNSEGVLFQEPLFIDGMAQFDVKLKQMDDNTIGVLGGFGRLGTTWLVNNSKQGLFKILIDLEAGKVKDKQVLTFSHEFASKMFPFGFKSKYDSTIKFDILDFYINEDQALTVVGQNINWKKTLGGDPLPSVVGVYYGGDIVVISANTEGIFEWGKRIEKDDKFYNTKLNYFYSFTTDNETINIIYNDKHPTKEYTYGSRIASIDKNGNIKVKTIFEDEEYSASSAWTNLSGSTTLIFEGFTKNKPSSYRVSKLFLK